MHHIRAQLKNMIRKVGILIFQFRCDYNSLQTIWNI